MISLGKIACGVVAVLAFGAARLPIEAAFHQHRQAADLRENADVRLTLREHVSQSALFAVLGGLRALVAALWDLAARDAWEKTNYAEVERDYRFIQQLQPRVFYYWDMGQWMLATNAARFFRLSNSESPERASLLSNAYVEKGREMIQAGIRNLPNEYRIHQALARLLEDRYETRDYAKIAEAWANAARLPGAPGYTKRFHAYALTHIPDRENEAEQMLRQLFHEGVQHHKPTLETLLGIYEAAQTAQEAADPSALHALLRRIYDRGHPLTRTPLLIRTIRRLEDHLALPAPERLPPSAEATAGQNPPEARL
ncbi:MAG: hypothetical protein ACR2OZ_01785 [Verrucomicrobiales bacterium]